MNVDIYVLNRDLEQIAIIDSFTSLIWASRYNEIGDCELYVKATQKNLEILKKGYYLTREDDEMVCRIEQVELDTDIEVGNYLIVTAYDVKKILYQRVIWSQTNVDGNIEDYIRNLVYKSCVNPNLSARAITDTHGRQNFMLGDKANFKEVITQQVSYDVVGSKIEELCKQYEWGFKVIVDLTVHNFYFCLFKGTDKSDYIVFSKDYENLISTTYKEDSSHLANVALVAGEGEGSKRSRNVSGYAEGLDRYEIYVDARDLSKIISWEELISVYPTRNAGGHGYISDTASGVFYKMDLIDIAIVDENQLTELKSNYPNGQVITKSGNRYYQVYDVIIADLTTSSPTSSDYVTLRPLIYEVYLLNRGYEKMAEYGSVISFNGTVAPDITFIYKEDYFLGDLVTVENEYGISVEARIVEVIETYDSTGYHIEPKFEYIGNNTPII